MTNGNNGPMYSPPAQAGGEGDALDYAPGIPSRPIAGNTSDDDGQALDQYFEAMDVAPQTYGIPDTPVKELPKTTRLLIRSVPLQIDVPVMLFPSDTRRKHLSIVVKGGRSVSFGSEKSDTYNMPLLPGGGEDSAANELPQVYDFPGYTGAVWISSNTTVPDGSIIGMSTTE